MGNLGKFCSIAALMPLHIMVAFFFLHWLQMVVLISAKSYESFQWYDQKKIVSFFKLEAWYSCILFIVNLLKTIIPLSFSQRKFITLAEEITTIINNNYNLLTVYHRLSGFFYNFYVLNLILVYPVIWALLFLF